MNILNISEFIEQSKPNIFTHRNIAQLWMSGYGSTYKNSSIQNNKWYEYKNEKWIPVCNTEYMLILIKYTLASAVTQYLACLSQIFLTDPNPSVKLLENMNLGIKMMSHLNNHQFIRGVLRECAESAYNPNLENC